jgi:hypothetical protein
VAVAYNAYEFTACLLTAAVSSDDLVTLITHYDCQLEPAAYV